MMYSFIGILFERHFADVMQKLHKEPRIERVAQRVLRPTYIEISWQPFSNQTLVKNLFIVFGVNIAQKVPRRINKSIHSVYFTLSRSTALWALNIDPIGCRSQRRLAFWSVVGNFGKLYRQLIVRNRKPARHPRFVIPDLIGNPVTGRFLDSRFRGNDSRRSGNDRRKRSICNPLFLASFTVNDRYWRSPIPLATN